MPSDSPAKTRPRQSQQSSGDPKQDAAEKLGLEIDSLINSISNDITRFKETLGEDLSVKEISAQADEAMKQAMLEAELNTDKDPDPTEMPPLEEAATEPETVDDLDPQIAEEPPENIPDPQLDSPSESDPEPEPESDPEPLPEASLTSQLTNEQSPESADALSDSPIFPDESPTDDVIEMPEEVISDPSAARQTPKDDPARETTKGDTPTVNDAVDDPDAASAAPAPPDTLVEQTTITKAADTLDTAPVVPAPTVAAGEPGDPPQGTAETPPIQSDPQPEVKVEPSSATESDPKTQTTEEIPAADLEQLDRMLADAANQALDTNEARTENAAPGTAPADIPAKITPSSQTPEAADRNADSDSQSLENPESNPENVAGAQPSRVAESKIVQALKILKTMVWARIPIPVRRFLTKAHTVYRAIPYREKPAEWVFTGLFKLNSPWRKLSGDLQLGLFTITVASAGLGTIALMIVWMRGG